MPGPSTWWIESNLDNSWIAIKNLLNYINFAVHISGTPILQASGVIERARCACVGDRSADVTLHPTHPKGLPLPRCSNSTVESRKDNADAINLLQGKASNGSHELNSK
jgi:hypothetical protein